MGLICGSLEPDNTEEVSVVRKKDARCIYLHDKTSTLEDGIMEQVVSSTY